MRHTVEVNLISLILPVLLVDALLLLPVRAQSLPDHPQPQQPLPDAPQPQHPLPQHPRPQAGTDSGTQDVDPAWPREATRADEKISLYQPQLEAWDGDEIHAYAALSVESKSNPKLKYGVVWFTARTEVDKVNRQVTLTQFQITRIKFPAIENKEADYQNFLQAKLPGRVRIIALDRLEAALAVVGVEQAQVRGLPVNNDPPQVIFATKPATLVLIDGSPQFKDVGGTELRRVLNSQALILLDTKKNKYYLSVMDGWLEAPDLVAGPWSYMNKVPEDMKEITKKIQERQQAKAPEGTTPPSL